MSGSPLFEPIQMGDFKLSTRLAYAPLTRNRAIGNVPQKCMVEYYKQRTFSGALMITEATVISETARGYPNTPGLYTDEQIEAWKPVTKAVKEKGGVFLCQIWHCGRASLPDYQPNEGQPVGPSAVAVDSSTQAYSPKQNAMVNYVVPRPLEVSEIKEIIKQYATAAKNAIAAGFDGVEIHGANGYLLDQFLKQSSNKRTDEYGGSQENRCRLMLEVVAAVCEAIGSSKVGLRLSPYNWTFLDCKEPDLVSAQNLNVYLLQQLKKYNIAYVHLVSARAEGSDDAKDKNAHVEQSLSVFRRVWEGKLIAAGGYVKESAEQEIEAGADAVAFGRWWLANPDFAERLKTGAPLNKYNRDLFYSHEPVKGYTDYPFLSEIPEGTPTTKHYSGATVFEPKPHKDSGGDQPWTSVA